MTAILRLFSDLDHGGQNLKDSVGWKCCTATTPAQFRILLVTDLSFWVGRFQLVTGRQHGLTAYHAVHVKVIAQAGPKPHARLKKVVEQGDLLIVFCHLLLATDRAINSAMSDKK